MTAQITLETDVSTLRWDTVTIEQRSPDGSNVVGAIGFQVCPDCGAMVSMQLDTRDPDFASRHIDWHKSLL